jgi:restriction system protein
MGFLFWLVSKQLKEGKPAVNVRRAKEAPFASSRKFSNKIDKLSHPATNKPTEWTEDLIAKLDWRVFEKLCLEIWQEKGFSVKETGAGADGGVDFYLYAKATKQKIGVVQCKSWSKRQIDVKVLRELQGVVASEQLKLGLLMYSGVLSKGAKEFMKNPAVNIKAQGGVEILNEIGKLSHETQAELLKEMTVGDYEKPSCPNFDIKLVRRTASKSGKEFWGCANFPKCRYMMHGK